MSDVQRIPTLPLSTTMPAFSKLNKRRRVTCRRCGLPFGYVPLNVTYLEANLAFLYTVIKEREKEKNNSAETKVDDTPVNHENSLRMPHNPVVVHFNKNNANKWDIRARVLKGSAIQTHAGQVNAAKNLDSRMFLAMFLPDAINIRIQKRCDFAPTEKDLSDRCGLPYMFKFPNEVFQTADAVLCAGCDTCIGVRFEPHPRENVVIPTSSWRSSRVPDPRNREFSMQHTVLSEEVSETMGKMTRLTGVVFYEEEIPLNSVESEGWITLSLECVDIEPLFGLVGLEQFSIRYEGGEMSPAFYRAIESSSLLSQNSATWMIPVRRIRAEEWQLPGRVLNQHVNSWEKSYYDLERADKAIPHTLGHGDLVEATVRRLCPIYPLANPKNEEDNDPKS